MLLNVT